MANDDMVMALFNAMSNASAAAQQGATPSQPSQQQRQQGAAGFGASLGLDPHALELLQQGAGGSSKSPGSSLGPTAEAGEVQAMDWCFDWSNPSQSQQQQQQQNISSAFMTPGGTHESDTSMDWTATSSSGDGTDGGDGTSSKSVDRISTPAAVSMAGLSDPMAAASSGVLVGAAVSDSQQS
ncbi:hypothetical protein EC988_010181 [Linderina pennispora]|nr:hypothetical protein EC988_010181 [Linderina pennispora]